MNPAIIVASFGTAVPEAEHSCIRPVEEAVSAAFPERKLCRAFTSRAIREKLRRQGVEIPGPEEAIARLRGEGCRDAAVVSTHIIPGADYENLRACIGNLPLSEPLLATGSDLAWMAELLGSIAAAEGMPLLAMGHGANHEADATYACLRKLLPGNVFLACAEGDLRLEKLLPALEKLPDRRLCLTPLMLVFGSHAQKLLAGSAPDSWKTTLEARGFDLCIRLQGLGSLPAVQQRFLQKARRILE